MTRWTWAAAAALALAAASPALAQQDEGFNANNFHPATDPFGYVTVNGARSLDMFQFHVAGYLNWAKNPLQFPDGVTPEFGGKDIFREVTTLNATAGLGLLKLGNGGVQVGVDVPFYLHTYGVDVDERSSSIHAEGIGDIRAEAKGVLFDREEDVIGLGSRFYLTIPVGGDSSGHDFRSNNEEVNFGVTIILEKKLDHLRFGTEIGYESFYGELDFGTVQVDDKLTYGFGVAIAPIASLEALEIYGELFGHTRFDHPFDNSDESPMEVGGGVRYGGESNLFGMVGLSTSLVDGFGAPDLRLAASIGITF